MAIAHIGLNQLDQALAHLNSPARGPVEAETYRLLSLCRKKGDQAKADIPRRV